MANIQSQIKRNKTNEKSRVFNQTYRSAMRTSIKRVETAVAENNKEAASVELNNAFAQIDKAVAKGIVKKNFAARNKSKLAKKVHGLA